MGNKNDIIKWVLIAGAAYLLYKYLSDNGYLGGPAAVAPGAGTNPNAPGAGTTPGGAGVTPPSTNPNAPVTNTGNPNSPPVVAPVSNLPAWLQQMGAPAMQNIDQWSWYVQNRAGKSAAEAGINFDTVFGPYLATRTTPITWEQYLAAGGSTFISALTAAGATGLSGGMGLMAIQPAWTN